jgi:hypothetical protein
METFQVKRTGIVRVEENRMVINLENDLVLYYRWIIENHHYKTVRFQTPAYGAHITILNRKIHGSKYNYNHLKKYHKKEVEFNYDPVNINIGGSRYKVYWLNVDVPFADSVKRELNVIETGFLGYHITLGNIGKENAKK